MTEISEYLFRAYDLAWVPVNKMLDSAFLSAVFGSLAGAYFGARAAQALAARKQDKDELTKHIKATGYAVTLATSVLDFFVGTKKQQVLGITQRYKAMKSAYEDYQKGVANGSIPAGTIVRLQVDMTISSIVNAPVEVLRTQLVEKMQLRRSRPIRLQMALEQSAQGLTEFLHKRNAWVSNYETKRIAPKDLAAKLFGIPVDGVTDMTFPTCIQGLEEHCNDAVFFAHLLCQDIQQHARELRDEYVKKYGSPAPGTPTITYEELIAEGLIPPDSEYETWFTGFKDAPPYRNRYQRVWDWIKELFVPTKV